MNDDDDDREYTTVNGCDPARDMEPESNLCDGDGLRWMEERGLIQLATYPHNDDPNGLRDLLCRERLVGRRAVHR